MSENRASTRQERKACVFSVITNHYLQLGNDDRLIRMQPCVWITFSNLPIVVQTKLTFSASGKSSYNALKTVMNSEAGFRERRNMSNNHSL